MVWGGGKMTITTKYNVGDTVWFPISDTNYISAKVEAIETITRSDFTQTRYFVEEGHLAFLYFVEKGHIAHLLEEEVFSTDKEVAKYLKNHSESRAIERDRFCGEKVMKKVYDCKHGTSRRQTDKNDRRDCQET